MKQRTLRSPIGVEGVGLHSGKKIKVKIRPAPADSGVIFRRIDIGADAYIPAKAASVRHDTELATVIGNGDITISTIEHLMSALCGLGVDNVLVDVDGSEMPILDGSASNFVFVIQAASMMQLPADKRFIKILKEVSLKEGNKEASFVPYAGFKVDFEIDFNHPIMQQGNTKLTIDFSRSSYIKEVSRARTFGFSSDLAAMRQRKLALGGSLDNALLLDANKLVNKGGMRFPNAEEFVRHKILDAVGDFYLSGHMMIGQFIGKRSGHKFNNKLLRKLLADRDAYEIVSLQAGESSPMCLSAEHLLGGPST